MRQGVDDVGNVDTAMSDTLALGVSCV